MIVKWLFEYQPLKDKAVLIKTKHAINMCHFYNFFQLKV